MYSACYALHRPGSCVWKILVLRTADNLTLYSWTWLLVSGGRARGSTASVFSQPMTPRALSLLLCHLRLRFGSPYSLGRRLFGVIAAIREVLFRATALSTDRIIARRKRFFSSSSAKSTQPGETGSLHRPLHNALKSSVSRGTIQVYATELRSKK